MIVLALKRYAGKESESELVALTTSQEVANHWVRDRPDNTVEALTLNAERWPKRGIWNIRMNELMERAENDRIATIGPRGGRGQ